MAALCGLATAALSFGLPELATAGMAGSRDQVQAARETSDIHTAAAPRVVAPIDPLLRLSGYIASTWQVEPRTAETVIVMARESADHYALDPVLILAVIAQESSFVNRGNAGNLLDFADDARNDDGQYQTIQPPANPLEAHGLMQVAAKWHREKFPVDELGRVRLTTDDENIRIGTWILREYLDMSRGNLKVALQRYNGNLEDSTMRYARNVLRIKRALEEQLARQTA